MPLGDWTLEARIDGQLAGSHQFQVVGPEAPPVPSAPARRLPLERRDAYARVLALTARIETYDSGGVRLDSGPAALLDGDLVATSFSRLNNAARARIRVGNTAPVEVTDVVAFNRRQDWAVFHVPGAWPTAVPAVARADAEVGEVCYSATASPDGGMAVSTGEVVGTGDHATAGRRLYTTCAPSWESAGAPVLNEYGDVIGMVAAGTFPGVTAFARIGISDLSTLRIPVVPGALLQAAPAPAARTSFASLAQRGLFTPPVTMERQVLSGGFSTGIVRDGSATRPIDQRDQFTLRDNTVTTFVSWLAVEAFKGTAALRLYDLDNTLRAESPPSKVTLRKGDLKMMTWDLPRPAPGMYRVDILLGTAIAWRGHFQVVE